jgi:hypothetical protein
MSLFAQQSAADCNVTKQAEILGHHETAFDGKCALFDQSSVQPVNAALVLSKENDTRPKLGIKNL